MSGRETGDKLNWPQSISKLPYSTVALICKYLESNDALQKLLDVLPSDLSSNANLIFNDTKYTQVTRNKSEALLLYLGNNGVSVEKLLRLFDAAKLVEPQLVLRRKFAPVKVLNSICLLKNTNKSGAVLKCAAKGFPYPQYEWYWNDLNLHSDQSEVLLQRCAEHVFGCYRCRISNEIPINDDWKQLVTPDRQFRSEQFLDFVIEPDANDVTRVSKDNCYICLANVGHFSALCATDKVALIISNSRYQHLPTLLTPACDADVLAEGLMNQGFKTVALADLSLEEMRSILVEYCDLLGTGVYAVFYFVGHGFEVGGQCYLLPIDAPSGQYRCTDCLCAEEVLSMMQGTAPALNVILLDMCRRCPPHSIEQFLASGGAKLYDSKNRRNTVFGYATSYGEGAYEVRGQANGIFMKYFQTYLNSTKPIVEVLNLVLQDVATDPSASDIQFPEVKTNLSCPGRSLSDPLVWSGHTATFDNRTMRWQLIHELPTPKRIPMPEFGVTVIAFFDYFGLFSNVVNVFTRVEPFSDDSNADFLNFETNAEEKLANFIAFAKIDDPQFIAGPPRVFKQNGQIFGHTTIKSLQKLSGPLNSTIELHDLSKNSIVAKNSLELANTVMISCLNSK